MADTPQPALPSIANNNFGSYARFMMIIVATWIVTHADQYLVNHGWINAEESTQLLTQGVGFLLGAAAAFWVWWTNRQQAKRLNAAAATGNPLADPKAPETIAAVAKAMVDDNSPIKMKPTS